jgi:hypothetical protein
MKSLPALAFTLLLLAACNGVSGDPPLERLSVFKSAASVQCSGGGLSLSDMERELTSAGIEVLSSACGFDGNFYPAVCGGPDGRIGIFEIPADQADAAARLGFAPLNELPEATKTTCP